MNQKRKLGVLETYVRFFYESANGTTGLAAIVQITGLLTADLIKQGLILMQQRHPLLRAHLGRSEDGEDCFEIDEEPLELPLDVQVRKHADQWIEEYERQLNWTFIDKQRYLWHFTLLLDSNGETPHHELIVAFHHTVADGRSFGIFFRDLLTYVQSLSSGQVPEVVPLPLMPNFEKLQDKQPNWSDYLARSEAGFNQVVEMKDHLYSYEKNIPLNERKSKVLFDETTEDQLERMIRRARENNTTLTGLLYAALLIAIRNVKGNPFGSSGCKQIAVTPVDMRNHCEPVIDSDTMGCYVSVVTTFHYVDDSVSLWPLARTCAEEINNNIEVQAYYPEAFDRPTYLQMLAGMGKGPLEGKYFLGAGITNYGALDLPVDFESFRVRMFHSGAIRHAGDWLTLLHTTSVGGKLYFDFCYEVPLLSEESARKIVEEFFGIIKIAIE